MFCLQTKSGQIFVLQAVCFTGPVIPFLKLVYNGYNDDVMIFEVVTVV